MILMEQKYVCYNNASNQWHYGTNTSFYEIDFVMRFYCPEIKSTDILTHQ